MLYDDGNADDWVMLFTEAATFIVHEAFPAASTNSINGRMQLHEVATNAIGNREPTGQERHLLTNVAVVEQTDEAAEVAAILLLVRTAPDGRTVSETPGRYTGHLVKRHGGRKIDRWYVHLDADRAANLG